MFLHCTRACLYVLAEVVAVSQVSKQSHQQLHKNDYLMHAASKVSQPAEKKSN